MTQDMNTDVKTKTTTEPHSKKRGIVASSVMYVLISKRMFLRAFFTLAVLLISLYIIHLLFTKKPESGQEQLLNIFLGAYIGIMTKAVDFWFRKDDDEDSSHKDSFE